MRSTAGHLTLLFSTDQGRTFGDRVVLGRGRTHPAVAFNGTRLAVAWTGPDRRARALVAPDLTELRAGLPRPAELAVAWAGPRLYLAGRDGAGRAVVAWTDDGRTVAGRYELPAGDGYLQTRPALAADSTGVYAGWVDSRQRIRVVRLDLTRALAGGVGGRPPTSSPVVDLGYGRHRGTAVALARDAGGLTVAVTGTGPPHRLRILRDTGGGPVPVAELDDPVPAGTVPSLAYTRGHLHLGWLGAGGELRLAVSTDGGHTFTERGTPVAHAPRHGPGLAGHADGTLCLAYS